MTRSRPLRAILTLVTVLLGVATAVVAIGLPHSFVLINNSETGAGKYRVVVSRSAAYPDSDVMRILNAQPETASMVALDGENVAVPGIGPVNTKVFRGDSSQLGYMVIAGRWFSAPGEVLAPKGLLQDAHLKIGDTFTGTLDGQALQVRVVGKVWGSETPSSSTSYLSAAICAQLFWTPKSCSNACSNSGGVRRHVAAPGGL